MIDIHAHVLSGLDDGAESPEVSLEMARRASEDGTTHIFATPHVMDEEYSAIGERIEQGLTRLRDSLMRESLGITLLPGAEVHVSSALLERPESLRRLTLGFNGKYVLLELPLQEMPKFTHELVFKLLLKGLSPILAHPERNMSIMERPERLLELTERGALVQMNAGSILGKYGGNVRNTAELLLRNRLVHFIASDAHSTGNRSPGLSSALGRARELIGEDARALVEENPSAVLNSKTLEFRAPRRLERTGKRFFSWLSGRFSS